MLIVAMLIYDIINFITSMDWNVILWVESINNMLRTLLLDLSFFFLFLFEKKKKILLVGYVTSRTRSIKCTYSLWNWGRRVGTASSCCDTAYVNHQMPKSSSIFVRAWIVKQPNTWPIQERKQSKHWIHKKLTPLHAADFIDLWNQKVSNFLEIDWPYACPVVLLY